MISLVNACRHKVKELPKKKLFLKPSTFKMEASAKIAVLLKDDNDIAPLIRIFTGQLRLSSGKIYRTSTLSPPVGKLANVSGRVTPYAAVRYASKLYDVEFSKMMTTLLVLTELEEFVDTPISEIPTLLRNRFHHALWLSLRFDTYIYMQHCEMPKDEDYSGRLEVYRNKVLADSGMLLFTRNTVTARKYCDHGIVFADQGLLPFGSIDAAIEYIDYDEE